MRDQYFVLLIIAALVMGCQSKTKVADGTDGEDGKPVDTPQVSTESDTEATEAVVKAGPVKAEPDEVCTQLLTLLKNDETAKAQKLFTRKAVAMMLRFDMPLGFPGQPDATFDVLPAKYATSKQELCQVMCTITEMVNGKKEDAELGWMLKQSNEGWRVCGMLLPLEDGKPMDFLNFESSADIGRVKVMLTGSPDVSELQATNTND